MKIKKGEKVTLRALENFDEIEKSLFSNFKENFDEKMKAVWLVTADGKRAFQILVRSAKVSDEFELIGNKGQLYFTGQLLQVKNELDAKNFAGTIFGGNNPFLTGYLTTKYGGRTCFFASDTDLRI